MIYIWEMFLKYDFSVFLYAFANAFIKEYPHDIPYKEVL